MRIEDNLVNQLLADAADEPVALALLQETMGLLWRDMEQRTLAFSPDMTTLVSGGGPADKTIRLWRWDAPDTPPQVLPDQQGVVNSLQFSADGKRLLPAGWDSELDLGRKLENLGKPPHSNPGGGCDPKPHCGHRRWRANVRSGVRLVLFSTNEHRGGPSA